MIANQQSSVDQYIKDLQQKLKTVIQQKDSQIQGMFVSESAKISEKVQNFNQQFSTILTNATAARSQIETLFATFNNKVEDMKGQLQYNQQLLDELSEKQQELVNTQDTIAYLMEEMNTLDSKIREYDQLMADVKIIEQSNEQLQFRITSLEQRLRNQAKMQAIQSSAYRQSGTNFSSYVPK